MERPFREIPLFVDRENTLRDLRNTFTTDKATAPIQQAIRGLCGIGKTQCALEYAYRYRDNYQAVLWTNANSEKTLVAGFVTIATCCNYQRKTPRIKTLLSLPSSIGWKRTGAGYSSSIMQMT